MEDNPSHSFISKRGVAVANVSIFAFSTESNDCDTKFVCLTEDADVCYFYLWDRVLGVARACFIC